MSSCLGLPDAFGERGRHIQLYKHGIPMNHSRTAIASGLLAVALTAPAQATLLEASASASITNLTITLTDLRPLDGVAPALSWISLDTEKGLTPFTLLASTTLFTTYSSNQVSATRVNELAPATRTTLLTPKAASQSGLPASAEVSITSNSLSAQAHASLDPSQPMHNWQEAAYASVAPAIYLDSDTHYVADRYKKFVISPYTQLTIQGSYAISVDGDDQASASVTAKAMLNGTFDPLATFLASARQVPGLNDPPSSESGTFSISLSNKTMMSAEGTLDLSVVTSASITSLSSSVPEPEVTALAAVGLVLLGFAARRQRQMVH